MRALPSFGIGRGGRGVGAKGSGREKRKSFLLLSLFVAASILGGGCSGSASGSSGGSAKSIILLIGDGMGAAHREATRLSSVGLEGDLAMDELPYSGLSRTASADLEDFVTDSAAGGVALASGVKTYNGAVGVDAEGGRVPTILEQAEEAGKSTGLVTTSQVTDATPAAFAAHVPERVDQSEIARQYVDESQPDVILGGGEDYWYPEGDPGAYPNNPADNPSEDLEEESKGSEGALVDRAERSGYTYVADADELERAEGPKLLGLFANEEMFQPGSEDEGGVYDPAIPLPEMTRKAIETLSENEEGFFLLVEEEAVDEMSHKNNAELMLEAGRQLDGAVEVARAYAEDHPNTLLIVAADHETGGLALEGGGELNASSGEDGLFRIAGTPQRFSLDWTTRAHTSVPVPITAEGPEAEGLGGVYENTHVYEVMKKALLGENAEGE